MTKKRTGGIGLTRGMDDAQRRAIEQARKATGKKDSAKAGNYYRKSYLLTMDLIEAVKETAEAHQVGISEFVRWALTYVINGVQKGNLEIPTVEKTKRRIDF